MCFSLKGPSLQKCGQVQTSTCTSGPTRRSSNDVADFYEEIKIRFRKTDYQDSLFIQAKGTRPPIEKSLGIIIKWGVLSLSTDGPLSTKGWGHRLRRKGFIRLGTETRYHNGHILSYYYYKYHPMTYYFINYTIIYIKHHIIHNLMTYRFSNGLFKWVLRCKMF